jgi:hypothetical protein
MVRVAHVLVLGIVVAGILGCQGGASGPAGYPVSGIVTYNQKPVDGAQVFFSPAVADEKLQAANAARATTDSCGRYLLWAQPGEYVVVVTKYQSPQAAGSQAGEYPPPEEGQAAPAPKKLLYAEPVGYPLYVRVEAKANEINLELTD